MDEPSARLMRFNNYVELVLGPAKARATLVSLAVDSLSVRLAGPPPGLVEGAPCTARLYFQVYQFSANGRISSVERSAGDQITATVSIEFTPELIEIVDDYFFRQSIQGHPKTALSGA
jgi:hypothetical protein